jgi:hypothetical protein
MELVRVKSLEHLKELCSKRPRKIRLALNGGAYSKKHIRWSETDQKYKIFHCIDGARETLTEQQMRYLTNISTAIDCGALFMEEK